MLYPMRQARLRGSGRSFYHCISRVVDRRFIFGDQEKEFFVALMRKLESFHGLQVVTYCVMSNHFHILLDEPDRESRKPLSSKELLDLLPVLYDYHSVRTVKEELKRAEDANNEKWVSEIIQRYEKRRGDVSIFMKELKQRFTQWYNGRNARRGTLWEDRYKSVLVEDNEQTLLTMATYIDLNPVRAGMVSRIEDYRWCGYAEATAGNRKAQRGLGTVLSESLMVCGEDFEDDWKTTTSRYRMWIYDQGEECEGDENGIVARRGFSSEEVESEIEREGEITLKEALRNRVRYFTDGAVLGSRSFVEKVFQENRQQFGGKRKTGARAMRGANWESIHVLRDLRGNLFG